MKKKILFLFTLCLLPLAGMNAQDEQKQPKQYLPEEGDWAIGIDVVPVLRYIGNAFNGNTENGIGYLGGAPFTKNDRRFKYDLMPDVSIMGKYMFTDKWGIRANVGLMMRSEYERSYVSDDKALLLDPFSEEKLIDKAHHSRKGMSLAVGAEYRKGSKRVQGVFGAGILFAFQSDHVSYNWGNQMTIINQKPTSSFDAYKDNLRLLEDYKNGADFYTGITGSAGIEWFVCPKISLGAEVNLAVYYLFGRQTYQEGERYNQATGLVEKRTDLIAPGDRGFYVGTESLGGSLNMTFYF